MSWEVWFLLWAIFSIGGITYCAITSFWIFFGVSITSLILCAVFYTMIKMVLYAYENHAKQSERNNANHRESMLQQGYEIIEEGLGYQLWGKKNNRNTNLNTSQNTPISTNNMQIKDEL